MIKYTMQSTYDVVADFVTKTVLYYRFRSKVNTVRRKSGPLSSNPPHLD